ncbi:MAG TPA: ATP-binding cassette domain-containing protein, partial [Bacillota bacterium]|nr:ATP-binding cassette domain-containing protein [Bacillota bacterium]
MLRIELRNVVKSYQDRLILSIDELRIYAQERVGIVGLNGSGKTTLLNIIAGHLRPDEGTVKIYGEHSYITQLTGPGEITEEIQRGLAHKLHLPETYGEHLSGGEKTRYRIAEAFSKPGDVILADEPTTNLDLEGIQLVEARLQQFPGAVLMVSHDRELLDKLCTKILEIEAGEIRLYNGNYSGYLRQKEQDR